MRYSFYGTFLLSSLLLVLASCESTYELPDYARTRLTIVSHLSPESWDTSRVAVYTSKSPLDSSQFFTPVGVRVMVTDLEDDITVELDSVLVDNRKFFTFPSGFLQTGRTYSISASAPGFETVHASTYIPEPSVIQNLEVTDVETQPSDRHDFKKIVRYTLVFDIDHVSTNRYYHLVFYNQYENLENFLILVDPESDDEHPFLRHYDFGVLIDKEDLVPGQPLEFKFVDWVVEGSDIERIYVELRSISEEYYKYHSTLARQLIVRQDPFAEPVSIFNNIEGGYGNFSGFTPNISSSDLPE